LRGLLLPLVQGPLLPEQLDALERRALAGRDHARGRGLQGDGAERVLLSLCSTWNIRVRRGGGTGAQRRGRRSAGGSGRLDRGLRLFLLRSGLLAADRVREEEVQPEHAGE